MMQDPLVSVCCLTYNHKNYIKKALDGFVMQKTNFSFEVLAHDDASTDGTAEILREYEIKYPDLIKPIYQVENQYSKKQGPISVRFVYPKARGKYIALCEGDDYWIDENKLQIQIEYLENNPECSLCMHAALKVNKDGKSISKIRPYKENHLYAIDEVICPNNLVPPTASMVFRKDLLKLQPNFFTETPVGDTPLKLFLATQGPVFYIDKIMSAYRVCAVGSWTERMKKDNLMRDHHYNRMKEFYLKLDKYTDYKYSESISREIDKRTYSVLISNKKFKEAKQSYPELHYKNNFLVRLGMELAIFLPFLSSTLLRIKRMLIK